MLARSTEVLRRAFQLFLGRNARFLGAAVAFYALLSAAPLLVVVLRLVGAVFGRARAEGALWGGLGWWLAPEGVDAVRTFTERLDRLEARGSFVELALVIYGSTRLFRALHQALNQLWEIDVEAVERHRPAPLRYTIRYGGAVALALLVALLVAALALVKTAFALIATLGARPPPSVLWIVDAITSIGFTFVLFTALFRLLPERRITLKEAATSAGASTILFGIGSALVTVYLGHRHLRDVYAGASAVVLAVLWVYYSSQVFFFGACIGAALHSRSRKRRR
jgi:membrane protein